MSTDLIKLGHLFAEIISGHDMSRFDEIIAPNYVNHNAFAWAKSEAMVGERFWRHGILASSELLPSPHSNVGRSGAHSQGGSYRSARPITISAFLGRGMSRRRLLLQAEGDARG